MLNVHFVKLPALYIDVKQKCIQKNKRCEYFVGIFNLFRRS